MPKITKKNKKSQRRSRPQTSNNGFRSGFEVKLAHQLERSGIRYKYETLQIEYQKISTYTPDFILPNGIIVEAKGLWTTEDRKKHLLVREQHPQLDIRLVFQNANNKIRKGSNTTYAGWCEKKGIKYAKEALLCSKISKSNVEINVIDHPIYYPSDEPDRRCPNISKAKRDLFYKHNVELKTGIRRFLDFVLD